MTLPELFIGNANARGGHVGCRRDLQRVDRPREGPLACWRTVSAIVVWWHLHEEITRNHRCRLIDELVELVFDWFGYKDAFAIETSIYPQAIAA
ncbi:MAG: hypothetical protein WD894_22340 [Pirellulales bacterium]